MGNSNPKENYQPLQNSRIVYLNVGGKKFTTFVSTLEKTPYNSILYKLVNTKHKQVDKDGNLFLDRDPNLFEIILNALRQDKTSIIGPQNVDKYQELKAELEYYGLDKLIALKKPTLTPAFKPSTYPYNNGNQLTLNYLYGVISCNRAF